MENIPTKHLIKTAISTSPIMALMLVTPIFILTTQLHQFSFLFLWSLITIAISFAWLFNISFLVYLKYHWVKTWVRIFIIGTIMYIISFFIFQLFVPKLNIDRSNIEIIRFTNILAINAFIFILTDLIVTRGNKNKFALENAHLKLVNLEAEYKLLKEQINPHFLFNALSTAKALIKKQPELAEEYIIRLSEFLRASINNNKKTVSLKEELALCKEYITLNKIRFGDALLFQNNLVIDPDNYSVPYFSILSLIENAIKHNSFTAEKPLQIKASNTNSFIEIKNNKQHKFILENSSKTGLKNLNDRYKLLNTPEIIIQESENEYSVKIALIKK